MDNYFIRDVGNSYFSGHTYRMFLGIDPFQPPPPIEETARDSKNSGSGSYYKLHLDPFLASDTYTSGGKTFYTKDYKQYWAGSDLCRIWLQQKSSTIVEEFNWRQNQNYPDRGAMGSMFVHQLVPRDANSATAYTIYINWYSNRATTRWGPWGCKGNSAEEVREAILQVLDWFNLPDYLSNPVLYGSVNRYSQGPVANSSLGVQTYTWQRTTAQASDSVHMSWRYDDLSNSATRYEWFQCTEGFIPGRIRNTAANALANALADLPEVSANSVANVVELASGLSGAKALFTNAAASVSRMAKRIIDPRNAWLSWRYVYNTTKMDLDDYRSVTNRLINMAGAPTFKVHGSASYGGFTIRCVKQFATADFNVLDYDTRRLLRTYGFQLSAYNAWDMVPFSFIVDWFAHVGPKLELAQNWNRNYEFTAEDTWFSYREQLSHGFIYYRWHNTSPDIPPTYVPKQTSKKTITYRLADTVSIFT